MTAYPRLLAPLQLGSLTLANRVVMGAMHTRIETLDRPVERIAAFAAARARGEAGLILTGGHSPNEAGRMDPESPVLESPAQVAEHRVVTDAVHAEGGRIVLQILHAGRYARVLSCVGPTDVRARINPHAPRALATEEVWDTVDAFARTARLARDAGYDGVEVMGSEGYLISQFTAVATNLRSDEFGGDLDGRLRLPLEIVRAVRAEVGAGFLLVYRISALDLVDGGLTGDETERLARDVVTAGADVLDTGIGWHESGVPTMAATVPRAAWRFAVQRVKDAVAVPVIFSNRVNTPEVAEQLLADGVADLVSMARPLLADPDFARKARLGRADEITPCIACNQACLDRIFTDRAASCMLNPRAGRELDLVAVAAAAPKRIAVVGGGPAGMAFAIEAAQRGHRVVLHEAAPQLGGQLNMARRVPGKREFDEALRSFRARLDRAGVELALGVRVTRDDLPRDTFDEVVIATGVVPRMPAIAGIDHPKVVSYVELLTGAVEAGRRVAIVGAGGIGFDVAEFLLGEADESLVPDAFLRAWGVDEAPASAGGLAVVAPAPPAPPQSRAPAHEVTLLQRTDASLGRRLGKSTGWILKLRLRRAGVAMVSGATYERIDDDGLHYVADGERRVLDVDTVVICAGQESERTLYEELLIRGRAPRLIGGAHTAAELDAVAAIEQATRLALEI